MKKEYYPSLKLELGKVSNYIQNEISEILGRKIVCSTNVESNDYWGVRIVDERLSLADIKKLLSSVNADDRTVEETLPEDAKSTQYLGMRLSSELLKKALKAVWKEEYVTEKALWLIDVDYIVLSNTEIPPSICFVGDRAVDTRELETANDVKAVLEEQGSDYDALRIATDRHCKKYGDFLFWNYPLSDGEHSGVYFVLVKEGILLLPYNRIEDNCYEQFVVADSRLCTHLDINDFINGWKGFSERLQNQMEAFKVFLGG